MAVTTTDPAVLHQTRKLAAIEAISQGRFVDAQVILAQFVDGPAPVQRGVCKFCGCSEARACGILVADDAISVIAEPRIERCSWADDDCTVCTNVSCLERWRRESPIEYDVDVYGAVAAAAPMSRIVQP